MAAAESTNMRLGHSGIQEGVSIVSIALTMAGIFSFESKSLYERGNTAYISLPLSILLSLSIFLLIMKLMRSTVSRDLYQLIRRGFGDNAACAVSVPIMLLLLFSAYLSLSQFVRAMHGLFFEGVTYSRIALFIIPAVLALTLFGFETICRTSKCFAFVLAVLLVITVSASIPQFEVYRLFPFPGKNIGGIAAETIQQTGAFLPAMVGIAITAEGLNDTGSAGKAVSIGSVIAAIICFAAQFAVALIYTYSELAQQFIPLFRINYLNMFEAHLLRMDKLAHIIWLNGAMISSSFYLYSASLIFVKTFTIRDIRPTLAVSSFIVMILLLIETETANADLFFSIKALIVKYSFLILSMPIVLSGIAALIKARGKALNND